MSAQLVTSTTISKGKQEKGDSGMFMELGVGALKDADGVALDLGFGYRKVFTPNIAWDILKLKAAANLEHLSETISPQLLTAFRGTSPEFAGMTAFASIGLGYGYYIEGEKGGFAYEFQTGLNVLPRLSVAFAYNRQSMSEDGWDYNITFIGAKVGFKF